MVEVVGIPPNKKRPKTIEADRGSELPVEDVVVGMRAEPTNTPRSTTFMQVGHFSGTCLLLVAESMPRKRVRA